MHDFSHTHTHKKNPSFVQFWDQEVTKGFSIPTGTGVYGRGCPGERPPEHLSTRWNPPSAPLRASPRLSAPSLRAGLRGRRRQRGAGLGGRLPVTGTARRCHLLCGGERGQPGSGQRGVAVGARLCRGECVWVDFCGVFFCLFWFCRLGFFLCRGWLWVCVPLAPLGVCARGASAARGALVRGSERSCRWEPAGSRGERWVLGAGLCVCVCACACV